MHCDNNAVTAEAVASHYAIFCLLSVKRACFSCLTDMVVSQPEELRTRCHSSLVSFPSPSLSARPNIRATWVHSLLGLLVPYLRKQLSICMYDDDDVPFFPLVRSSVCLFVTFLTHPPVCVCPFVRSSRFQPIRLCVFVRSPR